MLDKVVQRHDEEINVRQNLKIKYDGGRLYFLRFFYAQGVL